MHSQKKCSYHSHRPQLQAPSIQQILIFPQLVSYLRDCTVAQKWQAMDSAHMCFFMSSTKCNVWRMNHYKECKQYEKTKSTLTKLKYQKVQQDIETSAIQQCVLKLQERKLQLEVFTMENELLKAHGQAQQLISAVQPMTLDALVLNIPVSTPIQMPTPVPTSTSTNVQQDIVTEVQVP